MAGEKYHVVIGGLPADYMIEDLEGAKREALKRRGDSPVDLRIDVYPDDSRVPMTVWRCNAGTTEWRHAMTS
jgi:hypothetical protein